MNTNRLWSRGYEDFPFIEDRRISSHLYYYDPRVAYIWLNVYDMTPRGGGGYMGLNVHVKCKYMCNRVDLVVKGSDVQVWIVIYKRSCIHYWGNGEYERYLVIWRGLPYCLKSFCVTYLYWSFFSTLTLCTWCVLMLFYDILSIWILTYTMSKKYVTQDWKLKSPQNYRSKFVQ